MIGAVSCSCATLFRVVKYRNALVEHITGNHSNRVSFDTGGDREYHSVMSRLKTLFILLTTVLSCSPGLLHAQEVRATIGKITANASAIEFVAADLNSDVGWADAVAGADYVLHVASPVPTVDPKSDDELVRPARDGTLRVLKAARDAGVKRVVMTSSISAIMFGRGVREKPFAEADWTDETNRDFPL